MPIALPPWLSAFIPWAQHHYMSTRYLHVSASCGLPWHANSATTMAQRAFALPLVAADQPPFSWTRRPMTSAHQIPGSMEFSIGACVYAHPLAAAHWSSRRSPLADPAPQSRILQRGMLCCAVLCYAVLSSAINQTGSIECQEACSPGLVSPCGPSIFRR